MEIIIDVLNFGTIEVELLKEYAPITVDNFLKLVNENYFENSSFHRVIEGFMIQGGMGKTNADSIKGEFSSNGVENNLKHTRGVISMARTMVRDSASSQFFIMHKDSPHLDHEYAAFGRVTSGIEVVDKIAAVKTNSYDAPIEPVIISSIKLK